MHFMSVVVSRLALRYCVIAIKFAIYSYTTSSIINRNLIVNYLVFVPHFLFKCDNSYMHKSQTMKIMKNNDDDDGWRPTTTKTIERLIPISSHWHKWVLLFVSMYIILVCDMRKGKTRTGWNHESNPIVSVSKCCYLLFLLLLFRQLLLFLLFFTLYSHKKNMPRYTSFFLHLPLHLSFNSSSIQYTELALHINIEMWFKNDAYKHFGQSLTGNSNICENWNNNYGDSLWKTPILNNNQINIFG